MREHAWLHACRKALTAEAIAADGGISKHCICRGVDFDDLLSWPVALLQQSSRVRERLQKRYKHILVDEFQDTNAPQYELVRQLAGSQVSIAWANAVPERFCMGHLACSCAS